MGGIAKGVRLIPRRRAQDDPSVVGIASAVEGSHGECALRGERAPQPGKRVAWSGAGNEGSFLASNAW